MVFVDQVALGRRVVGGWSGRCAHIHTYMCLKFLAKQLIGRSVVPSLFVCFFQGYRERTNVTQRCGIPVVNFEIGKDYEQPSLAILIWYQCFAVSFLLMKVVALDFCLLFC